MEYVGYVILLMTVIALTIAFTRKSKNKPPVVTPVTTPVPPYTITISRKGTPSPDVGVTISQLGYSIMESDGAWSENVPASWGTLNGPLEVLWSEIGYPDMPWDTSPTMSSWTQLPQVFIASGGNTDPETSEHNIMDVIIRSVGDPISEIELRIVLESEVSNRSN